MWLYFSIPQLNFYFESPCWRGRRSLVHSFQDSRGVGGGWVVTRRQGWGWWTLSSQSSSFAFHSSICWDAPWDPGPGYHATSSLLPSPHSHRCLCFCFFCAPLLCPGIHLLLHTMLGREKLWGHPRTHPLGSENHSSRPTGPWETDAKALPPLQSFPLWAPPARCTSCVHPVPTNLSRGSVVTPTQGLTWVRTGRQSSFSGIIQTKAPKCAPTTSWCFLLHRLLSPSWWEADPPCDILAHLLLMPWGSSLSWRS